MLNRRVDLHAIDATPARWRGDVGSSPLDGTSATASSPEHPTHWLISTQAARATIGFRTAAAGHDFQDWPIVERKLPTHYDRASGEFKFEDGDGLEVDCVIYCTGYRHTFPFLDEPLQLRTANRLAPDTLWKLSLIHI